MHFMNTYNSKKKINVNLIISNANRAVNGIFPRVETQITKIKLKRTNSILLTSQCVTISQFRVKIKTVVKISGNDGWLWKHTVCIIEY